MPVLDAMKIEASHFAAIVLLIAVVGRGEEKPKPLWSSGGFLDVGYLRDFNDPANHLFRSRGTAFHVNETDLNMAGLYVRKQATDSSRWGTELTVQGGKDSEVFGFSATAPNLRSS